MIESPTRSTLQQPRRRAIFKAAAAMASVVLMTCAAIAQTPSPKILRFSDHEPLGGMRTRFLKDIFFSGD